MNRITRLGAVLMATLVSAGAVVSSEAGAAPVEPSTPYPKLTIDATKCPIDKTKELLYNTAKKRYETRLGLVAQGAVPRQELRASERALYNATIELNNARYKQAACQNERDNNATKGCTKFALDLNQLIDELRIREALLRIEEQEVAAARNLFEKRSISGEEYDVVTGKYALVKAKTEEVREQVATKERSFSLSSTLGSAVDSSSNGRRATQPLRPRPTRTRVSPRQLRTTHPARRSASTRAVQSSSSPRS